MVAVSPEIIVITDDSSRAEIAEAITNLAFRAKREVPAIGTEAYPTPWDRRHRAIDELLGDWLGAPCDSP